MIIEQYYIECLSQASYLIGDETTGRAIVVDPRRDIGDYLADAEKYGLTIEGVINTHFRADFVSGHLELVEATAAWIGFGAAAETDYPIRRLVDGEHISLGQVDLEILATPGHTWESISVVVRQHPGAAPTAVLTGDSLFIGDVGRPDLVNIGDSSTEDLARAMYHSIHEKLFALPDEIVVLPAHGAGSACGKNLSAELISTIGEQRHTNRGSAHERRRVCRADHGRAAVQPGVLLRRRGDDKRCHELLEQDREISAPVSPVQRLRRCPSTPAPLCWTPVQWKKKDFDGGHLRGSVNVGFDGRFAETAGMAADVGEKIALVTYPGDDQAAAIRLARIGSDNAVGFLNINHNGDFPAELSDLVRTAPWVTAAELDDAGRGRGGIDRHSQSGRARLGTIPGAVHIPLAQLRTRMTEIPAGKPVVVHCAGGWRSSVGASLLRAAGLDDVSDLAGGYTGWAETHAA